MQSEIYLGKNKEIEFRYSIRGMDEREQCGMFLMYGMAFCFRKPDSWKLYTKDKKERFSIYEELAERLKRRHGRTKAGILFTDKLPRDKKRNDLLIFSMFEFGHHYCFSFPYCTINSNSGNLVSAFILPTKKRIYSLPNQLKQQRG